jgi:hypothetical protein
MSDQKMTTAEFVEFGLAFAKAEGEEICEPVLRRAARKLAARGVLAAEEPGEGGGLLRQERDGGGGVSVEGRVFGEFERRFAFRLHLNRGDLVFGDYGGTPLVTNESYRVIPLAALAELAAHFCGSPQPASPPQPAPEPPAAGEVLLRLTKEEAEAVGCLFYRRLAGGPDGGVVNRVSKKILAALGCRPPNTWRLDPEPPSCPRLRLRR